MEGTPAHNEVVILSPEKKERLKDALLRLTQENKIERTPEGNIIISNKNIGLLQTRLLADEFRARERAKLDGKKLEPLTCTWSDVEYYLLSETNSESITKTVKHDGPHHTTTILRPLDKTHRQSTETNRETYFGVPVPKTPTTTPRTESD